MLKSYPDEWESFRQAIMGRVNAVHPARAYGGQGVPFAVVKNWFEMGLANRLRLYRETLQSFRLDFLCLSFDSDGNETWRLCSSELLHADTYENAERVIEHAHLNAEYRARFAADGLTLNW